MARPRKTDPEIEVLPYMDTMVIVLNLICLILIIMIIPLALNPKQYDVLSFKELLRKRQTPFTAEMQPVYFECRPDGLNIIPGDILTTPAELVQPGNAVERKIDWILAHSDKNYVILLIRPNSLPVYRYVRKELVRRNVVTGFDVLSANSVLDWRKEMKELRIRAPVEDEAPGKKES